MNPHIQYLLFIDAAVIPIPHLPGKNFITAAQIEEAIIPDDEDYHGAPTRLICLENTLNGCIMPMDEIKYEKKNFLVMFSFLLQSNYHIITSEIEI